MLSIVVAGYESMQRDPNHGSLRVQKLARHVLPTVSVDYDLGVAMKFVNLHKF